MNDPFIKQFRFSLLAWYEEKARVLPWRNTQDPYLIWISEIILQQTRVVQGLDYYQRFIQRFPDIATLAQADEQEVLKYWQGLGYYSRARNLHASAKIIVERFGGVFPTLYREVITLKGIGEYTAAAICSFAYNAPYAVIDGNVYRFLSRFFAIDLPIDSGEGKKTFASLASTLLHPQYPALHNQAMMEVGATLCTPARPNCAECPFADQCKARAEKKQDKYPVKRTKTKVSDRYFHYFFIRWGDQIYLHKRTDKDIWQNLYEFPLVEAADAQERPDKAVAQWLQVDESDLTLVPTFTLRHVLSHCIIHASFYELTLTSTPPNTIPGEAVSLDRLTDYPISRLIQLYLEQRHPQWLE